MRRQRVVLDRLANIRLGAAGIVELALQQGVVGLKIPASGPLGLRRRMLTGQELRLQRRCHCTRDLVLQRKEILVGAIVAFRPLGAPVGSVDELGAHPHHLP